jgi:hypothetical protein
MQHCTSAASADIAFLHFGAITIIHRFGSGPRRSEHVRSMHGWSMGGFDEVAGDHWIARKRVFPCDGLRGNADNHQSTKLSLF